MFVDLLKPRWRHPSAAVRSIAATKLNPNKKSDAGKLRQLAYHDPDPKVRTVAITRLTDQQLLIQLLEQDTDPAQAELAASRLIALSEQGIINTSQFETVQNEAALSLLICHSQSERLHHALLPRIHNEVFLADIAMRAPLTATRQLAATQLADTDCLEKVRHFAKDHDKAVYRITRDIHKRSQQIQAEQQAILQQRQLLLDNLHALINSTDRQHFGARFQALQSQWNDLSGHQPLDIAETYQQLVHQAETILQQQHIEQAALAHAEAVRAEATRQLGLCQDLLTELLAQLTENSLEQNKSQHYLTQLDNEAQRLMADHADQLTQAERHEANKLVTIIDACRMLQQQSMHFRSLVEQGNAANDLNALQESHKAIKQALKLHSWPTALQASLDLKQLTAIGQQTEKRLQQLKQQDKAALAAIEDQLNLLDSHINQGETQKAQEQLERLNKQIKHLHLTESLQQQFRSLTAQVNEMTDWQQFAAISKKEQLCMAMEALIDSALEPVDLATQIRELQQQWKQLDQQSPTPVKPLWERFHAASRQAYQPCDAYYKELSRLRAWNLSQRELICQHLETYFSALDWSQPDWRALEQILKKAKHEWREFSPVDRAPGKLLQTRFQQLLDQAEQALQTHRSHCAAQKQALVDEAIALSQSEDIVAATEGIKALQQAWKTIGSTAKHKERKLWEAFRYHGDQVFAQLRALQQTENQDSEDFTSAEERQTAARLLCIRLEILFNQPSPESDQYLRMEYQMQRLQEALEPCSDSERKIAVQRVIDEWNEAEFGEQFETLQQRFANLLSHNE
ncbi:DUF349 domain-containing protein [Nitrincola iocasae]|uniref:DUF349 domain-containing protein n=1 Tax=Nitrincola iocasae TaxID=2614693 RepID=A0A5J6LFX5_9GAMM|nr:DUF349 domain-containing protein [Nitrincola iocasae]QEW07435.1 DUF349 domain-containing protein [Nitrincola iocasae]